MPDRVVQRSSLQEIAPEVEAVAKTIAELLIHLRERAYLDRTTQLLNAGALARFEDVRDRKDTFGAVFVDLTGFKAINDTHGHEAGDAALAGAARELEHRCEGGAVFRKGGDEFVILAKDATKTERCAKALARAFNKRVIVKWKSEKLRVGGAVGFGIREDNETPLSKLIEQADLACRAAKEGGSTTAIRFSQSLADDEVVSERKRCASCGATSSMIVHLKKRRKDCLTACSNCGRALA